jgi:hypothetical protein
MLLSACSIADSGISFDYSFEMPKKDPGNPQLDNSYSLLDAGLNFTCPPEESETRWIKLRNILCPSEEQ